MYAKGFISMRQQFVLGIFKILKILNHMFINFKKKKPNTWRKQIEMKQVHTRTWQPMTQQQEQF